MDPKTATEKPEPSEVSDAANEASPASPNEQPHEGIRTDLEALLDEMQTTFKSFSEDIFTKIDDMQGKIDELDNNVNNLSVTTTGVAPTPCDQTVNVADDAPSESHPDSAPALPAGPEP